MGVSTHNLEQLRAADATSADYIAVGPIFAHGDQRESGSGGGAGIFARGAWNYAKTPCGDRRHHSRVRRRLFIEAGADSVAVIRDLMAADDPAARALEYLAIAKRVRAARSVEN